MNHITTMIAICLICLVAFMAVLSNIYTVKCLIVLCFFQNILLVLLSPFSTKMDFYIIVFAKEVLVLLTILLELIRNFRLKRGQVYGFMCIFVMFLLLLFYGSNNTKSNLMSFRQLIVPFEFYLFGRVFRFSIEEVNSIIKFYIKICVFACLFGYIELVVGDRFWEMLGIKEYTMLKYGQVVKINNVYCWGNMYTTDLIPLFGKMFKRMCSILVDPVIFSQLLAVALTFVVFYKELVLSNLERVLYIITLSSGLILTYGKGGMLIFIGAMLYICYCQKARYRKLIGVICCVGVVLMVIIVVNSPKGSSINNHLIGLTNYISIIWEKPLGGGIGTEGNLASHYREKTTGSGESFVGSLIGQIGIIGIIIYMSFIGYLLNNIKRTNTYNIILYGLIAMVMITSLFNNTAISFTNCFIYFILAGIKIDYSLKEAN